MTILGVRAGDDDAWRGREATGEARDGARRRRGAWPAASARRRRTGEGERREREIEIDWFKFKFFSKIPFETWKTLNMKVVENLKAYNFYLRKKFIRAKV